MLPPDGAAGLDRARDAARWLAAQLWRGTGRIEQNRTALYGGRTGLRIAVFHGTPPRELERLKRVVEWWRERGPFATPADVDALVAGEWRGDVDRLLLTFDDGLASNYAAAAWLADVGLQAAFFVIPSFLNRTVAQFVAYHRERGVEPFPPDSDGEAPGLSTSQVREMLSMGHRVAAHNNAHRDLGLLHQADDLRYEIRDGIERVGEVTGAPCRDFAVGFGQPWNLSAEAAAYLRQSCPNVYMCHRGLNTPGLTPRFLLRHALAPGHPLAFTRVCLEGGADHRLVDRVLALEARVGRLPGRPVKVAGAS
jgi:peptidoglycan/xylan/chitin deacetylase (PgdA/CDA1 family)